jgi:2'-5' RNA ligase
MPRLFTGIEVPKQIADHLSLIRGGIHGARWIDPENYHVTLRFLADIDDATASEVDSLLARVHRAPLEVKLDGLSSFGGNKPRAIIATVAPSAPLMEMQAEQERMMQRLGLPHEGRKYTPHVTLARLRDVSNREVADFLASRLYFAPLTFTASRFVLYSSRASTGGGPYRIEQAYPLSA